MADPAQDQGQQVVQSFASDLEERIKEKNHIEDVNDRKTNRLIRTVFSVRASVINSSTGRPEVQDRARRFGDGLPLAAALTSARRASWPVASRSM